jgi:hypothetical protein
MKVFRVLLLLISFSLLGCATTPRDGITGPEFNSDPALYHGATTIDNPDEIKVDVLKYRRSF